MHTAPGLGRGDTRGEELGLCPPTRADTRIPMLAGSGACAPNSVTGLTRRASRAVPRRPGRTARGPRSRPRDAPRTASQPEHAVQPDLARTAPCSPTRPSPMSIHTRPRRASRRASREWSLLVSIRARRARAVAPDAPAPAGPCPGAGRPRTGTQAQTISPGSASPSSRGAYSSRTGPPWSRGAAGRVRRTGRGQPSRRRARRARRTRVQPGSCVTTATVPVRLVRYRRRCRST